MAIRGIALYFMPPSVIIIYELRFSGGWGAKPPDEVSFPRSNWILTLARSSLVLAACKKGYLTQMTGICQTLRQIHPQMAAITAIDGQGGLGNLGRGLVS